MGGELDIISLPLLVDTCHIPIARNGTPNGKPIGDMLAYTANAYRNNQAKKQTEKTKICMVTAARDALDGSCELAAS